MTVKQLLEFRKSWLDNPHVRVILRVFPGSKLIKAKGTPNNPRQEEFGWK